MPPAWPPPHPLLCLVTDRLALCAALGLADPVEALERQVASAVEAGVDLVHLRERDLAGGALRDLAGRLASRVARSDTRLVVNDRLDLALASGADGVHLRGDSLPPAGARSLVPGGFLLGRSVRSAEGAAEAGPVDYVVLGTVCATPSKPGVPLLGPGELARAARLSPIPVLAIGGVSDETLPEIGASGAAGIAAIRLFFEDARDGAAMRRRAIEWRRAFDTHRSIL